MQKFTIRDIENMCGIKAHTLRIWEHRYHLFTPKRKESAHRYYDDEDLKKLLRIAYLYHSGWKVSKIADLGAESIAEIVRNTPTAAQNFAGFVLQLLEAAVDFDETRFNQVLDEVTAHNGLQECIIHVGFPFLQKIGLLWMTSNIIPAQEHFSTYLIQHKIISETEKLPVTSSISGRALLFTPDGEHHELPLLFINYLLKKAGWRTLYFGSNVKWQQLLPVIEKRDIDTVYLHLITNFTRFEIDDYLQGLSAALPGKRILASGAAVQASQRTFVNIEVLRSDEAILKFIRSKTI
ncbi:MAG TPA: MerR family transcriptional regulator [Flavisolibacter sp.]